MGITCIYKIEDHKNRIYIGSSVIFRKRKSGHLLSLKNNKHCNKKLQNAYNKYGEDVFVFSIVEHVENKEQLVEREQFYINTFKPYYNICQIAGSPLGTKHSKETKDAHSLKRKGKAIHSEEFKKALSERNKARVWSQESKNKLSEKATGKKQTAEWIQMIKETNTGRVFTEEHKKKIGLANKGKPFTEKMRLGVILSNQNRAKKILL